MPESRPASLSSSFARPAGIALVAAAFLTLSGGSLAVDGVRAWGDAERYLTGAEYLRAEGRLPPGLETAFVGYSALLALCQVLGTGYGAVVALQLAMAAAALHCQWRLGRELAGWWAGTAAAGFLALSPEIADWHSVLMTDSLYISLVSIGTWVVFRAGSHGPRGYLLATAVMLSAALIRPTGCLLALGASAFWLLRALPRRVPLGLVLAGITLIFVAGFSLFPESRRLVAAFRPGNALLKGVVVGSDRNTRLSMPPAPDLAGQDWTAQGQYVLRHPWSCLRLAVTRVAVLLLHIRHHYSVLHNVLLLAALLPLYSLAVVGALRCREEPLLQLILLQVGIHLLPAALFCADVDGRYLLHFFPLIGVLAGAGVGTSLARRRAGAADLRVQRRCA